MVRQLPISPLATSLNVTKVMKANKASGSKPEILLRKFLSDNGFRGYRLNWPKATGRPDICYPSKKIAIFVHGCFWHRCPYCNKGLPKTNTHFWEKKFQLNASRDASKRNALETQGWKVLEVWECELKSGKFSIVIQFLNT